MQWKVGRLATAVTRLGTRPYIRAIHQTSCSGRSTRFTSGPFHEVAAQPVEPGPGLRYYLRQPRREQHVPGQRAHSATDNGPGWRDRCNKPIYADVFPRTWPAIVFSQNNTFFPTNQMQKAIYKILDQSIIVIKKRCNVLNCKKNCGRY